MSDVTSQKTKESQDEMQIHC